MNGIISVVIPVYNHAHTLDYCVAMVLNQQYDLPNNPIEIIIVNDGSADNFQSVVGEILKGEFAKSKIKKVINQENKGAPAARNRGLRESVGEFVIFVDADTVCYPHMFEEMLDALQMHPEANYAYSQFRFGWKKMQSHEFDGELLKKINYIDVTSLIRRKDLVTFDESLKRFQDWDLWLTMLEQNKIGIFVPRVLFKKIVWGRMGISSWLPSLFYRLLWKTKKVKDYEAAKNIIIIKHGLK